MAQSKFTPDPRQYTKSNYVEIIENITPEIYQTEDLAMSGEGLNPLSNLINTHLIAADNVAQVLSISAIANSQTADINNISGISQYFVLQNDLTKINSYLFETKILNPLGTTFVNFNTNVEFKTYLSGTLLPKIRLATGFTEGGKALENNINTLSSLTGDTNPSSVHNYLVDALGWFYFLNTSAQGSLNWEPSGYVLEELTSLFSGKTLGSTEGIKGFENYIWRNYATCTTFSDLSLLPQNFASGPADAILEASTGTVATYTSGTQKLDMLLTLLDVVYSPYYMDQENVTVKNAFDDYISVGIKLSDQVSRGPFRKFTNALGYSFADTNEQVEAISLIYDIENTKDEYLQYIADLLGWKLLGGSPAKWRQQLRVAVEIYKRIGTLAAIQYAINSLIVDYVFDVSAKAQELWESYIPFLIWYALGTGSPYFRDLTTWTPALAQDAGVHAYSTSSLEKNIMLVTDTILLELYIAFPDNFLFNNKPLPVPRLVKVDRFGDPVKGKSYTVIGQPGMKPFHCHRITDPGYEAMRYQAWTFGESESWKAATVSGPLGYGVYMAGDSSVMTEGHRPTYLSSTGDLNSVFNYRGRRNYPIPPFEEIRFYRDTTVTAPMVELLKEKLICFGVNDKLATDVQQYILSAAVTSNTDLGSLNEFLMLFSSVQIPPNYDDVMFNISNYQKNLLGLWNGKSSHLFINFDNTDFDFAKTTMEGDSKYALYEAARLSKMFAPGHTITRVNLNASAHDPYEASGVRWEYLEFDHEDTRAYSMSASILANFASSGVDMGAVLIAGGGDSNLDGDAGRGGLNTFKRSNINRITDNLLSSVNAITDPDSDNIFPARRALRRRNLRNILPREGYYDRTAFNAPSTWDPSTIEYSTPSSIGELTLGYVASAAQFFPIVDPLIPSGIWHICENLDSTRTFSGVDTSNTFPYRGLSSVSQNNNERMPELSPSTTHYVDRDQLPIIYRSMHNLYEALALDYGAQQVKLDRARFAPDSYWKNNEQSFANIAISSGLVINSYDDYTNFKFGVGVQKVYRDYKKYYPTQLANLTQTEETGGNIFSHVFGKGLYNCDFSVDGSAVSSLEGNYISSSVGGAVPIAFNNGSGVFSTCAVYQYGDGIASGSYIASDAGHMVVPLTGTYTSGNPFNAEFRNPNILSGIEFVNTSGSPVENQFRLFNLGSYYKVAGLQNYLVGNPVIKCKTEGGFPRLRFDLSAYGDRRNYFIKDHKFKLSIDSLVGEEFSYKYGGAQLGVWIHTNEVENFLWSWTPAGKWELHKLSELSIDTVKGISHIYTFPNKTYPFDIIKCLGNVETGVEAGLNDITLNTIQKEFFETFEITFDTRNYTIHNNFEYLKIIPVPEEYYKLKELVHTDNTNYIVEIFFLKPPSPEKYLLIDNIRLEDTTLREWAAIGTGHGIETKGIPLRRFVEEDKLYLNKENLRDVLKFYNGLNGEGIGTYQTSLAARDASITSGIMEASGGSRLNYRISPSWGLLNDGNTQANYNNLTSVEVDN